MKRVLKADLFELRRSKAVYMLPLGAVLLGLFLPLMYFGLAKLFDHLAGMESLQNDPTFAAAAEMLGVLDAKTVFRSVLPLSQGFGLILAPVLGFRAVRPFSTGVYRNKLIAGCPRGAVYLSQTFICILLALFSGALYTLTAALACRVSFGTLGLTPREIWCIAALSFGVYLVYAVLPVFIAFLTRSIPLTIIVSMALPILMQTVISLISPALINAGDTVIKLLSLLPSFQSLFASTSAVSDPVLAVSLAADLVWAVALTAIGIAVFKKSDVK